MYLQTSRLHYNLQSIGVSQKAPSVIIIRVITRIFSISYKYCYVKYAKNGVAIE